MGVSGAYTSAVPSPQTALITGVTGQDGTYLARSLAADGWRVVGATINEIGPADGCYLADVDLRHLDVRDAAAVHALVAEVEPDRIYNLAAISSVAMSWEQPELTFAVNTEGVRHLLSAIADQRRRTGKEARLLQASSAEVRGSGAESPYAKSKAAAERLVLEARAQGTYAACAVLFNHESPLRPERFVTRKIARAAAEIARNRRDKVTLGNLDVRRDWGFAGDYVGALRALLEADEPADVEIGTGVAHSLGDLLAVAFDAAGLDDPGAHVLQDPGLMRSVDADVLVADPDPARRLLGWTAATSFADTVRHMVDVDLRRLDSGVEHDTAYLWPSQADRSA